MGQEAAVEQLRHDIQLGLVARILQTVRRCDDGRTCRDFLRRKRHSRQHQRQLNGKRLDKSLVVGVPLVLVVGVGEDFLIGAEILEHARADQLLLLGIDDHRRRLDLLNVRVLAVEHGNAGRITGQIVPRKAFALGSDVLFLEIAVQTSQKPDGRSILDAIDNALGLRLRHLHGRHERTVVRAEEIVLVLVLGQDTRSAQLDRGLLTAPEAVLQIRLTAVLTHRGLLRQYRIIPDQPSGAVLHRHDKGVVLHQIDGRQPRKELARIHKRIGLHTEHAPQIRPGIACHLEVQLAAMPRKRRNGRACQLHLVQTASISRVDRLVGGQCLKIFPRCCAAGRPPREQLFQKPQCTYASSFIVT